MNYENEIKSILAKRGIVAEDEVQRFLNPSIQNLHDPFLLNSMDKAVTRIEEAIKQKQTILIYGDYDADGICSVSILFLYLKSRGVDPIVFIPNRHTDGYGLNEETIEMLSEKYFPDLFITVDTGISAKSEIALLNELGIDCIVTDHHEPPAELPDCIVVDPKVQGQKYPFNGLSGAGVVFKLVSALGGVENALQYLDICAISTIGDIVPLQDENRIITTYGLNLINAKDCRPSIAYLKKVLKLDKFSSTDISFKVVPRLNASGRMDSCLKCFHFLISKDNAELKEIFESIEQDNNERLRQTSESVVEVEQSLKQCDIENNPVIIVRQDNLNLGIIGIVASRLCSTYLRPVFVFARAEDGSLKCSVRSIDGINVFSILDKYRHLMIDIGGHSLAGGLTIAPENFQELVDCVQSEVKKIVKTIDLTEQDEYDLEITERHLNMKFAEALVALEPFGFGNPKPTLLLKSKDLIYENMKSFRHYKILTPQKKEIVSFFGNKFVPYFHSNCEKNVLLQIDIDTFMGKEKVKAITRKITATNYHNDGTEEDAILLSLFYKILSLSARKKETKFFSSSAEIKEVLSSKYGTLVMAGETARGANINDGLSQLIVDAFPSQLATTHILSSFLPVLNSQVLLYKNLVFMDGYIWKDQYSCFEKNLFVKNKLIDVKKYSIDRQVFAKGYSAIRKLLPLEYNNFKEELIVDYLIDKLIMIGVFFKKECFSVEREFRMAIKKLVYYVF